MTSRRGSHWWPRTGRGRFALVAFVAVLGLAQPPIVFWFANRTDPWVLGMPFLYAYLTAVYVILIAILVQIYRWRL